MLRKMTAQLFLYNQVKMRNNLSHLKKQNKKQMMSTRNIFMNMVTKMHQQTHQISLNQMITLTIQTIKNKEDKEQPSPVVSGCSISAIDCNELITSRKNE